jgi:RHS repeat-associated protein
LRATVPRWQGMSGGVRYVWDAENRLRAVIPAIPVAGQDRKVEYGYDYLGRRVIRRTYDWDGQALAWTGPVEVTKYVYNGWRVIMELDGLAGDIPTRKFSWGLDLAAQAGQLNSLESAGGIGGLLAAEDTAGTVTAGDDRTFIYFADANGNIGQVVETTAGASYGTVAAHYEYAPFGKRINPASPTEYDQPYRFSSKPFDPETELGYWGYRHYSPELGRWISRDPIGERGGVNVYAYLSGDPIGRADPLGLRPIPFKFYVFIPGRLSATGWIREPGSNTWEYKTDQRGFGQHPTSRMWTLGYFESTKIGKLRNRGGWHAFTNVGESARRKITTPAIVERGTATLRNEVRRVSDGECASQIEVSAEAGYPFIFGGLVPPIRYTLYLRLTIPQEGRVTIDWRLVYMRFPDNELKIDNQWVHQFPTPFKTPIALITQETTSGSLTVDAETPKCCPPPR